MGNCVSGHELEAQKRSHQIDKVIQADMKRLKKECKLLLLGSGESGKSTIVKQMRIIHQGGFTSSELLTYRTTIYMNLLECGQNVAMHMHKLGINCKEPGNADCLDTILQYKLPSEPNFTFPEKVAEAIHRLWGDPSIIEVMEYRSQFYLMDNGDYFFKEAPRIGKPNYVPTETDVLRCRAKSTGIVETRFSLGPLTIHMFDVGGQRSERKKWIHCFESVTSIIFCTALSEYDQVLLEEANQNRMKESLVLFDSVVNSRWFLRTSVVLFLNKVDIFKKKLPKSRLENYFSEYTGGADVSKAAKFILWKFMQANRARLAVYAHLTQATDTSNVRLVFAAVSETILANALKESGIL